ncbi:hypothetical protein JTB14_037694 [Gonioctena quinquepunctata]|nr:hypothetical protein JTB14_037694 [Gonioctena quinquepunctata]
MISSHWVSLCIDHSSHWDQELLQFWDQHPDRVLTKMRFNEVSSQVRCECMTPANIISRFRAIGLYPFNPEAIPEHAFAPPIPTKRPAPTKDQGMVALGSINLNDLLDTSDERFPDKDSIPLEQLVCQLNPK